MNDDKSDVMGASLVLVPDRSREVRAALKRSLTVVGVFGAVFGGLALYKRATRVRLPEGVVSIVAPVIWPETAEAILRILEPLGDDEVTLLLHTNGGCISSCIQIADALRKFRKSTAVVPYMALSGGTLIALNAKTLYMGRNASLSAVDPIIGGRRGKNLPESGKYATDRATAKEYEAAIRTYLRSTLEARLPGAGEAKIQAAMDVFMGKDAPHEWPIRPAEVGGLGIQVGVADSAWAKYVDGLRDQQDRQLGY